jgi:hypothetical protein
MPTAPGTADPDRRHRDDGGLSMIATLISMVGVALLVLIAAKATLGSSSSGSAPNAVDQPVAAAEAGQAQQALSTALGAVTSASGATGSFVGVDAATLGAAEPSLQFTDGASTGPGAVSVAATDDGSGAVTLAVRATGGTCWFAWRAPDSTTWYGAQTGGDTCVALPIEPTPTAGAVSSSSIGWSPGSFPTV